MHDIQSSSVPAASDTDTDKIPDGDGDLTLEYFCKSFNTVVDKHAPYKKIKKQARSMVLKGNFTIIKGQKYSMDWCREVVISVIGSGNLKIYAHPQ